MYARFVFGRRRQRNLIYTFLAVWLSVAKCISICTGRERHRERERDGERVSCTTCLWFHVKYVEKWPTLQADTFRGVARNAKTRQKLLKSLQVELACGARLYSALQTFWFTVCGRAQECLHRDWERERERMQAKRRENGPKSTRRQCCRVWRLLRLPALRPRKYSLCCISLLQKGSATLATFMLIVPQKC